MYHDSPVLHTYSVTRGSSTLHVDTDETTFQAWQHLPFCTYLVKSLPPSETLVSRSEYQRYKPGGTLMGGGIKINPGKLQPYACEDCGKPFSSTDTLRNHRKYDCQVRKGQGLTVSREKSKKITSLDQTQLPQK